MVTYDSMQLQKDAMVHEARIASSLRAALAEISEGGLSPDVKAQVAAKLERVESESLLHQETLNYWIEQINAGARI